MNFTPEQINLCKQIAEKYRKEMQYGDWYWHECEPTLENPFLWTTKDMYAYATGEKKYILPLWTVSDCLEFLKSRIFYGSISDVGAYYEASYKKVVIGENDEDKSILVGSGVCETPLEACLKAVIEVLKNERTKAS